MKPTKIISKFYELFDINPSTIVRSPGRINIIGEHTDYNDGFVFPAAIDKEIVFAVSKNNLNKLRLYSYDFSDFFEININSIKKTDCSWANYLIGVLAQFQSKELDVSGLDCVFGGNIPIGAGLSSSAAIENGFAFAIDQIFDFKLSRLQLVKMAQKAEHEYAGVMCGIMDQFASMYGKINSAIKLDCRSLEYEYANINLSEYSFVLCNTMVSHSLASSAYNDRRMECAEGVNIIRKHDDSVVALRDVNLDLLEKHKKEMNETVYKRCLFVVNENKRVLEAINALKKGDLIKLGELISSSHEGLDKNYDVSCKELNLLIKIAQDSELILGARMMGGGFGGCTLNLVKNIDIKKFSNILIIEYQNITSIIPDIHVVQIAEGTSQI